MNKFLDDLKRWGVALIIGGIVGGVMQFQMFYSRIEYDCKIMKAFRIDKTVYDCKERA